MSVWVMFSITAPWHLPQLLIEFTTLRVPKVTQIKHTLLFTGVKFILSNSTFTSV